MDTTELESQVDEYLGRLRMVQAAGQQVRHVLDTSEAGAIPDDIRWSLDTALQTLHDAVGELPPTPQELNLRESTEQQRAKAAAQRAESRSQRDRRKLELARALSEAEDGREHSS